MTTIGSAGVSPGVGLLSDEARAAADDGGLPASLVQLGNQLRSSPDIDGVVRAVATAAATTFGFNEVSVYLRSLVRRRVPRPGDRRRRRRTRSPRALPRRYRRASSSACSTSATGSGAPSSSITAASRWPKEFAPHLPSPDLGPRERRRVAPRRRAARPPLRSLRPRHGRARSLRPGRPPGARPRSGARARGLRDVRRARRRERASVRGARGRQASDGAAARGPPRPARPLAATCSVTLDHTAVFEQIADVLKSLVDYDCIDISLVDEARNELVTIFAQDAYADQIMEFRVPLDQGVSGWVVRHKQAQLVNDMYADPRVVQIPGTGQEPQASILVPLMFIDKVLGVLIIDRLGGRIFERARARDRRSCSPTWRRSPSATPAPTRRWRSRRAPTASPASTTTATSRRRWPPRSLAPSATRPASAC